MIKPRSHWLVCLGRTISEDLDSPNPTYMVTEKEFRILAVFYERKAGPALSLRVIPELCNYLIIDKLIESKNLFEQRPRYFKITLKGMKTYDLMYWCFAHKREKDLCRVLGRVYDDTRLML